MATPIHQSTCRLSLCALSMYTFTNSVALMYSDSCWISCLLKNSLLPFCFASAVLFVLVILCPLGKLEKLLVGRYFSGSKFVQFKVYATTNVFPETVSLEFFSYNIIYAIVPLIVRLHSLLK